MDVEVEEDSALEDFAARMGPNDFGCRMHKGLALRERRCWRNEHMLDKHEQLQTNT